MESITPVRVVWPPPGLESYPGILWRKAGELGFGGTILVLPLLCSVTWAQPFNSLGLFGEAWWILGLSSLLGVLLVLRSLSGLMGFFWRASRMAAYGIDLETTLQVGADRKGDVGPLLQGTRSFYALDEVRRARAVRARIWESLLFLSAAMWIPVGWVLSLFLASRGFLSPTGVWVLTMGPTALNLAAGTLASAVAGTALHGALGPLSRDRRRNPGQQNAALIWGEEIRQARARAGEPVVSARVPSKAGFWAALGVALLVSIPTVAFTVTSSVGSILAAVAVPKFSSTQKRAGAAEALRRFRLPPDSRISPMEAGEALQALLSAGGGNPPGDWMKDPVRILEAEFYQEGVDNPTGIRPEKWAAELFPAVTEGLPPEAEVFLREVAAHPGLEEFEVLARAPALDVLGARYRLPLPEEASAMSMPIPRLSPLRKGSYALVAKAAVQLMDGDPEAAEVTLKTALSAGFLLGEESPTLIDALIGYVLVANAGDALAGLYEASGRDLEAKSLRWVQEAAADAAEKAQQGAVGNGVQQAFQLMPERILDEAEVRGVRWEYFMVLAGVSPCINPHQIVFGPDGSQVDFMQSAYSSLVRYPSEAAVWEVMKKGFFDVTASSGWEGRMVDLIEAALGERAGGCAAVLASGFF
jgi:hypothetical protein